MIPVSDAADQARPPKLDRARERAKELANGVSEDVLAQEPLEVTLEWLVTEGAPELVTVDVTNRHYRQDGTSITLTYPMTGQVSAVMDVGQLPISAQWSGSSGSVSLRVEIQDLEREDFVEAMQHMLGEIDAAILETVRLTNDRLGAEQAVFTEAAREILERRWKVVRTLRGAMQQLDVPLGPRATPLVHVPVRPGPQSLKVIEEAAKTGAPQYALADDMAESVISTISSFGLALERLPKTAAKLIDQNEESLRDVLLFILNANFTGQVTGETFIGEGKADLLLRWNDRDAFVGECKIWKGSKALHDGLDQLLDRYVLWRHTRIALVVFIRDPKDASNTIDTARRTISEHPRVQHTYDAHEPARRSDFDVLASGDEQRPARLALLPVVIA